MKTVTAILVLLSFQPNSAWLWKLLKRRNGNPVETDNYSDMRKPVFVNNTRLDFCYWNSDLGNDRPIPIEFGNESTITEYWLKGLPLKVITHGWLASDVNSTGVFEIKTAYVRTGGYNVISVDWSKIANNIIYPLPAILTVPVGETIAEFLHHLIDLKLISTDQIHLIGHSLGAHVVGACGAEFKHGKIGRITGLDPAKPGFEFLPVKHLNTDNAEFVDVIHTAGGSLGFISSLGHADFFPNGGFVQPGCGSLSNLFGLISCSHSRSHELYTDSVYHRRSLSATQCTSLWDYLRGDCDNNTRAFMGHDAVSSIHGNFFMKTNDAIPFGFQ